MNGFDRTPEGEEMIALLKRAAPKQPDSRAAAQRVMRRINGPERRGWLGYLAAAGALAAAAAIAVVVLFPPRMDAPESWPQPVLTPNLHAGVPLEGLSVGVREVKGDWLTLDVGLSRGLRVGDSLRSGDVVARVTAAGIFTSLARLEQGKVARGDRLVAPLTDAVRREQRYELVGGDPGALYDFGAVVEAMPRHEARLRGIADGKALVVVETIEAIWRPSGVEVSLAGGLGLKRGDVILNCNGLPAGDLAQFTAALELSRRGGQVKLRVLRGTSELELARR